MKTWNEHKQTMRQEDRKEWIRVIVICSVIVLTVTVTIMIFGT